ncbi:hypothetical protein C8R44DRAFT_752661 [Mycena epipterygia]|nr:hypothetical protein C8R44DRAFT_752661 [Mycena epipterygia]
MAMETTSYLVRGRGQLLSEDQKTSPKRGQAPVEFALEDDALATWLDVDTYRNRFQCRGAAPVRGMVEVVSRRLASPPCGGGTGLLWRCLKNCVKLRANRRVRIENAQAVTNGLRDVDIYKTSHFGTWNANVTRNHRSSEEAFSSATRANRTSVTSCARADDNRLSQFPYQQPKGKIFGLSTDFKGSQWAHVRRASRLRVITVLLRPSVH